MIVTHTTTTPHHHENNTHNNSQHRSQLTRIPAHELTRLLSTHSHTCTHAHAHAPHPHMSHTQVGWTVESETESQLSFVPVSDFGKKHVRTHICECQLMLRFVGVRRSLVAKTLFLSIPEMTCLYSGPCTS